MKRVSFENKFYRDWIKDNSLYRINVVEKETDLFIQTDKKINNDLILKLVINYRAQIQDYIDTHKDFLYSLKPLKVESRAPSIVKLMARSAKLCDVGPMASVAGAIAEFIGKELTKFGCREVLIENGGDLFIKTSVDRMLAIYSSNKKLNKKILLNINSNDSPLGVCASSGTIGHSLSFGEADCVVICAENSVLADAAATSACNMIKSKNDLSTAIEKSKATKGIKGIVAIIDNSLAAWGNIVLSSG